MAKFFAYPKALLWWIGLVIFAAFTMIYAAIGLNYINQDGICGKSSARDITNASNLDCSYHQLIGAVFIIFFIVLALGVLIKLNQMKIVSLIMAISCFVVAIIGLAYIGGAMSDDQVKNLDSQAKANIAADGVYMLGAGVGFGVFFIGVWQSNKTE